MAFTSYAGEIFACQTEADVKAHLGALSRETQGRHGHRVSIEDHRLPREAERFRLPAVVIVARQEWTGGGTDGDDAERVTVNVYSWSQLQHGLPAPQDGERAPDGKVPTLYFGKHRGQAVSAVPLDYLRWLADNVRLKGRLRRAVGERL